MRGVAAVTLALTLAYAVVPAAAQQREVKPTTDTAREADRSSVGTGSVTGTIKQTMDNGLVVVGRETGKADREWAFTLDASTRVDRAGRVQAVSDLRQGDPVTVSYTNRDGKVVAQNVTLNNP
ncbi:MAG TPA: hypothetical protein VL853_03805 [Gemmatimonadales bacterium]|nr:hypothetical protein [Gemmatimonadales bacterium]